MKSLRLLLCALPLALTGCSTLSSINWSAAYPWNWFGSSTEVTEQGVGKITAATALDQNAIQDALSGDYRLRSGMKTENGNIVRYYEALKGDKLALVINGDKGTVNRIAVMDGGKIIALDTPKNLVKALLKRGFKKKQHVEQANLEDVFIDLTGKELRD